MNIFEALISLVASHNCIVCDFEGSLLCGGCLNSELKSVPSRCYRCHKTSTDQAVCRNCRKSVPIKRLWAATDYSDVPKRLIHKLKFERAVAAAMPIAEKIDQTVPNLPEGTVICHIPTANSRIRLRGYDQAEQIAKNLAKLRGHRQQALLHRAGRSRQVGSGRKERFKHLDNAFKVKTSNIAKTNVLLIDDITTTGATVESAAKVLKKAGARTIDVAVFAQA